jgi:hypothetical protein
LVPSEPDAQGYENQTAQDTPNALSHRHDLSPWCTSRASLPATMNPTLWMGFIDRPHLRVIKTWQPPNRSQ